MTIRRLSFVDALRELPPEWPHDPLPAIRSALDETQEKIVVLDDDPTGVQTVHDVPVLAEWPVERLVDELTNEFRTLYLLTNSRSVSIGEARSINADAGRNLAEAARRTGRRIAVVSRSDSTLRGHYPGEVEALARALGQESDSQLLIPFFLEGGRYTINNVHYVAEGEWLIPAGETESARDLTFGYSASDLREWVQEKTKGRIHSDDVASVSIEDIRLGGPDRVAERLADLTRGAVCVINAASMRDLEVFTQGLLEAERRGQRFLYRTAASFVRARSGLEARPLLTREEMDLPDSGAGLVLVGSHVPRTTAQLTHLLGQHGVIGIEVQVEELLSREHMEREVRRAAQETDGGLRGGSDVALFTSRRVAWGRDAQESLSMSRRVSEGLVAIARAIKVRPRYLLAKGGITASDIATRGLSVRRAMVLGQVLPGVPVWELGPESRYPGLKYIVFPGNVGGPEALTEVATKLRRTDQ